MLRFVVDAPVFGPGRSHGKRTSFDQNKTVLYVRRAFLCVCAACLVLSFFCFVKIRFRRDYSGFLTVRCRSVSGHFLNRSPVSASETKVIFGRKSHAQNRSDKDRDCRKKDREDQVPLLFLFCLQVSEKD